MQSIGVGQLAQQAGLECSPPSIPTPRAWGKLERSASEPKPRLSLVAHCLDVAAVFQALLQLPVLRRRLERLAGRSLDAIDLTRLTVLAFLHDAGKAGAGFYSKALEPALRLPIAQQGHTRCVAPLLHGDATYEPHRQAIRLHEFLQWTPDPHNAADLWLAAISHHGQPLTLNDLLPAHAVFSPTWTQSVDGYCAIDGLRELGHTAAAIWPEAWGPETRGYASPLVHAFAGLVALADWVGSNTRAQDFFPYNLVASQDAARWPASVARAAHALRATGLDMQLARDDLRRRTPSFEQLFQVRSPRPLQLAAADHPDQTLVVLEADTGSGKTEAALWRFKTLFEAGEVDALCFLLPTRVAATGIYQRLQHFVERAFPDPALRPPFVLAVPSDLQANGAHGQRLAEGFEVLWPDAEDVPPARFWAAENCKRYFAAGLVAGTIDQFLLSALRTGHSHLRAALTLRSLVVVDEVHASDAYMGQLLRQALARHAAAGGHALLLSATLTGHARGLLMRCAGVESPQLAAPDAPYPSLTVGWAVHAVPAHGRDKQVRVDTLPAMRTPQDVANVAAAAIEKGLRVMVVRNSVRQAVATQQALELLLGADHPALFRLRGVASLHHGRYALPDRQALDVAVGERFGGGAATQTAPAVLVGTQTLEISVDCDCDLLISDIAPIDVLLQRMGRLYRHAERDPHRASRQACCVLLVPEHRDLSLLMSPGAARGLGIGPRSAYDDLLLIEATWRAAENTSVWRIPQNNRALVEAGCDPGSLHRLAEEMGGNWPQHWQAVQGRYSAQRGQALPVSIDWRAPWAQASRGELDAQARTRLGLDTLRLALPTPAVSAFGHELRDLPVPAWMCPDLPNDAQAFNWQREGEGALLLGVADRSFVYDRWGLRREDTGFHGVP